MTDNRAKAVYAPFRAARKAAHRWAAAAVVASMLALAIPVTASMQASGQSSPAASAVRPLPPAEIDATLKIGGKEIDASKERSRMTVEVMINGTGPYRFVVDSGADTSVISSDIAAALKLPAASPAMLNTMTSSAMVQRVWVDSLKLGPTVFRELELPVLEERHIGADGMIGLDALVEQRLLLDFEDRVIKVDDARSPVPRMDGVIIVTGRLYRGQLILTEIELNGTKIEAVIDTGTEITIANSALRDQLLENKPDRDSTITIVGVTGVEADLQFAKVATIRLGPVFIRNVAIAFADVPPFEVFGLSDEPALLLGTDLMEQFRKVSLDFDDRKVRFQLKECDSNTVRIRTAPSYASRLSANRPTACSS